MRSQTNHERRASKAHTARSFPPRGLATALGTVALVLAFAPSRAAAAEEPCSQAVGHEGVLLAARAAAALAACYDDVSSGALAATTDCAGRRSTENAIHSAQVQLERLIRRRCTDGAAPVAANTECSAVIDASELAACLSAANVARTAPLLHVLYNDPGPVRRRGRRCQQRTSRAARRYAVTHLGKLQECKDRAARGLLPSTDDCVSELTATKGLITRRAKAAQRIEGACRAEAIGQASFGTPCAGAASGSALAECVLLVAEGTSEELAGAAYGDGGFCGDAATAIETRIDALLADMSLEEKIEQMRGLRLLPIDGLYHTPDNERLGIPGFRMVDGPRGVRAGNGTAFPVGMARGATWDPDLERRVGEAIGAETRAKGGSVLLAPVVNILRHPRWGRAQETYGEDPLHLGRMGTGFVRGAQQHVIASAKHFAANSIEDTRFFVDVSVDERTLREIYLPHFRMLVTKAHVGSVMSAYNKVNGQYCGENFHLLREILKDEWGFKGLVESDWVFGTRSTVPSATAGLDIEMPFPIFYGLPLRKAVEDGAVPLALIDDAVRRILRAKLCFHLDTDPPEIDPAVVESQAHADLALDVARKAIVLLKNDAGALPLDRKTVASIVVTGPLADQVNLGDTGSSNVHPSHAVTPIAGIRDRASPVDVMHIAPGAIGDAGRAAIAAADAVIVVAGLTSADEGEALVGAGDRMQLGLAAEQEQLIRDVAALNQRTIVILEGGSAITVESWIDDVAALLMAWYPGQEGGHAIADLLFGDVDPSGKLPITMPRALEDLPPFVNDSEQVTYGYYHGYRHVDREGIAPRFPFGYGLSYTTFAYSNLVVADPTLPPGGTLRVNVDVTNTGDRAGDEIVQLYVSYDAPTVDRPLRELKGFARVALAPGETRTVTLDVAAEDLTYYDTTGGTWRYETAGYHVSVGPSSRQLLLSAAFEVTGTTEAVTFP